jgi:hypothetical protein
MQKTHAGDRKTAFMDCGFFYRAFAYRESLISIFTIPFCEVQVHSEIRCQGVRIWQWSSCALQGLPKWHPPTVQHDGLSE